MNVQILMSTYNGARYLRAQLDSIVQQSVIPGSLIIRDDGSTDDTVKIIKEYQRNYPWISYYQGANVGVQRSFFDLIENYDRTADYIAFADQDDHWLPEKLERAVTCLNKTCPRNNVPLLYCSSQKMVGENLEPLEIVVSRIVRKATFGNALVQNICTGCTAVMNRELIELIRTHKPANVGAIVMHDWWFYLTASCFGKVYYDEESYIYYRQHQNNVHGAILSKRALLKYRVSQLMKPRGEIYRQAKEFEACFGVMMNTSKMTSERFLITKLLQAEKKIGKRIRVILDPRYFRQKRVDDIVFRGIVLIGKL
ncbi:MAG: glycosyltransferase family 2 protein [Lachnoclostridium sp.]|nr:glycosyltransferase family 2 protein [Lachnoclostridium sp.]